MLPILLGFNPYFPGLSCNTDNPGYVVEFEVEVSILVFLDSPATELLLHSKGGHRKFQSLFS